MEKSKQATRRLYRSTKERIIAGICGGLAEHFQIDPILIRLIFILLSLINGLGIIIYIVLWLLLPRGIVVTESPGNGSEELSEPPGEPIGEKEAEESQETLIIGLLPLWQRALVLGLVPIIVGAIFLMEKLGYFPSIWILGRIFWPALLLIVGILVIVAGVTKR